MLQSEQKKTSQQKYRLNHKEQIKIRHQKYYFNHKEQRKIWRKKNQKRIKIRQHEYYLNHKEQMKARARDWAKNHRKQKNEYRKKQKYGITAVQYQKKIKSQHNRCAICNKKEKQIHFETKKIQLLSIDHDHKTNKIRGLLCDRCNRGLGFFSDSSVLLLKASRYLRRHNGTIK